MCGIVGVLTTEKGTWSKDAVDFFKQSLFTDTLRGFDSTGVFLTNKKLKSPNVFKKAIAAPDFLQLRAVKNLISNNQDWNIMIGHNRAATKGRVKDDTSHPFQINGITLVHNGTVYGHSKLPDGNKFTVDSEAITHSIAKIGPEETIKQLDGAFTLVWYNENDNTLNMVRNEERPFAFAKVKYRDTILMASEAHMLQWLAVRNKMQLEKIILPKPGQLFSWVVDKEVNKEWWNPQSIKKVEIRPKKIWNGYSNYAWSDEESYYNRNRSSNTSKGNQKGFKNSNRGLTQPAERQLKKLGINKDDIITLRNAEFIPYHAVSTGIPRFGRIVLEDPDIYPEIKRIEINGVNEKTWNEKKDGEVVSSTIQSLINVNGIVTLFLNKEDLCFFPDDFDDIEDDEGEEDEIEDFEDPSKIDLNSLIKGPHGRLITEKAWDNLTKDGCAHCTGNIHKEDAEKTGWTETSQPICKDCVTTCGFEDYLQ